MPALSHTKGITLLQSSSSQNPSTARVAQSLSLSAVPAPSRQLTKAIAELSSDELHLSCSSSVT